MQAAERALSGAGYSVAARGFSELQLVTTRGGPLRLTVQFGNERVRLIFAPAAPGSVLPAQPELERVADLVLAPPPAEGTGALRATAPVATAGLRCGICATVIPTGAAECPTCRMPTT
jgi:hypothetical protein